MHIIDEMLAVLAAFGGFKGGEPGPVAVRFLLPSFFWFVLCLIALQEWRRAHLRRDLFISIASCIGISRELLMFAAEYGSLRGFVSFSQLYTFYPPVEHAATMLACILIAFAFMNYLPEKKIVSRRFLVSSTAVTVFIYLLAAFQWPVFLKGNPDASFGAFWGDLAFRIEGCLFLGFTIWTFFNAKRHGTQVQGILLLGFLFFFLDEFLMIFNITGDERNVSVYAPLRHNLHIWAVPLLLGTYWGELRHRLFSALSKAEEEKARADAIIAGIGDGLTIQDHDHRLLYQNSVHKEYFGDMAGEYCYNAVRHKGFPCEGCPVTMSFNDGQIHRVERTVSTPGRVRHFEITASPLKDSNDKTIAGIEIVRDVTERKRLQEELVRSQKLESLGVLAGGLAHDFNNLLTSIVGNISIARRHIDIGHPAYRTLEEALKASKRTTDLTHRLLTFSKGGVPIKEAVSLSEIIKESMSFSLAGSSVKFEFLAQEDVWNVDADPGQMSQVFNNLVLNAVEAMPQGGTLTACLRNVQVGHRDYVMITLRDEGTGIPKDILPKIFDPYFTTKQTGSGIGLSSVHSIISKHEGHIGVESDLGVGTTFTIHLKASHGFLSPAMQENIPDIRGGGRVLVMDDEQAVREIVKAMLEELGYDASLAQDGREGIDIYRRAIAGGQTFHAVIMDLTIPGGMGGKEAIQELRRLDPNVRAIVSSGYSNDPIMAEYEKFGFNAVIAKPYAIDNLGRVLRQKP